MPTPNTDANEQTILQCLRMYALSQTVREASDYLMAHPKDRALTADVRLAVETITGQSGILGEAGRPVIQTARTLLSNPRLSFSDIQKWGGTIQPVILNKILSEMQEITYLSGDVTEEIFRQLAESPQELTNPHANILFQTVLKGRISAPESCYRTFLWLIRRMPQMLSGNELHPGYVFQDAPQRTFDCCPVCKSPDCTPFHTAFSYAMVNFQEPFLPVKLWMKCEHCGNLHTFQFPESFLALSEHQELIQPSGICPDCISPTASGSVLSIWSEVLNLLRQYTDGTSVLEVGIGNGDFLSVALEMGYEPDAVEIEPERAQNVADILQLPVYCCDFLRFDTEKRYDILMMGDVIEHVTEPEQALLKAHRLLRENGVLWLSTPNFNSSFSRLRKFEDAMWKEPYHISYFSYETLLPLLQKCGFQVLHYKVSNRYNGSMELVLGK